MQDRGNDGACLAKDAHKCAHNCCYIDNRLLCFLFKFCIDLLHKHVIISSRFHAVCIHQLNLDNHELMETFRFVFKFQANLFDVQIPS